MTALKFLKFLMLASSKLTLSRLVSGIFFASSSSSSSFYFLFRKSIISRFPFVGLYSRRDCLKHFCCRFIQRIFSCDLDFHVQVDTDTQVDCVHLRINCSSDFCSCLISCLEVNYFWLLPSNSYFNEGNFVF